MYCLVKKEELYQLYRSPDIVSTIKSGRLRLSRHIQRMSCNDKQRRITESKPEGRRSVGRPKLRWMDEVLEDLRTFDVESLWMVSKDRNLGGKFFGTSRLILGCSADYNEMMMMMMMHNGPVRDRSSIEM
jgi:hypothetical protein